MGGWVEETFDRTVAAIARHKILRMGECGCQTTGGSISRSKGNLGHWLPDWFCYVSFSPVHSGRHPLKGKPPG